MSVFDFMYKVRPDDIEPFGDRWCGPADQFNHLEDHLVAVYKSKDNSDGQSVEVFASAAPARFWVIRVQEDLNSVAETQDQFEIRTGSGGREMATWVNQTAEMIAEGMLGVHHE